MAFTMLLAVFVVFVITALSFDTGLWYFDHRDAQSDSEAAALAAAGTLPSTDTTAALAQANKYLTANGAPAATAGSCPMSGDGSHIQFADTNNDGKIDSVTVCVRRQAPGFFAALSGINMVHVSASSTALAGFANGSNVMPWAVVARDPNCDAPGKPCNPGDAGGTCPFTDANNPANACPYGLRSDSLYSFKQGTGGNTGIIRVCGSGGSSYKDCLSGASSSGFYGIGDSVFIDTQPGTISNATDVGLSLRQLTTAWALPGRTNCDVLSTPALNNTSIPGLDHAGKLRATATIINNSAHPECLYRLVPIPILHDLPPNGQTSTTVIGVASFAVANWDRTHGNGKEYVASASDATCHSVNKNPVVPDNFQCGDAWGYLFTGVTPPLALLEKIGGNNPFAPILIALVD
jgi:hypothetical protein